LSFYSLVAFDGHYVATFVFPEAIYDTKFPGSDDIVCASPLVHSFDLFFDAGFLSYFGFCGGTSEGYASAFFFLFPSDYPVLYRSAFSHVMGRRE